MMHVVNSIRRWLTPKPRMGVQVNVRKARMGNRYGGYAVCPDRISSKGVVYSFGVGEDISFDRAVLRDFEVTIHAFDPTPRSVEWVRAQTLPSGFFMHEYGLAAYDGVAKFAAPANPRHVSHTMRRTNDATMHVDVPVRRLSTIAAKLGHEHLDVVKMDIEGAEYEVLEDLLSSGPFPTQILVEFHHQMPAIEVTDTERALRQLNETGYRIFDASPTGREFSLIRNP